MQMAQEQSPAQTPEPWETWGAPAPEPKIEHDEQAPPTPIVVPQLDPTKYNYMPRPQFEPYHNRTQRFSVIISHRRSGKTIMLLNDTIVRALTPSPDGLRQQFAFILPTQSQARAVAWIYLKEYTNFLSKCKGYKSLEQHLTITLPNVADTSKPGSTIMLLGAENIERARGLFLNGAVLDEAADISELQINQIIRPALADREGWFTISGTVKSIDDYLWTSYQKALKLPDMYFTMNLKASESGILPDRELESLKLIMTEEAFNVEFENDVHAAVTGKIFAPYLNNKQITKVPYDPAGSAPMAAWDLGISDSTAIWVAQVCGREVHVLNYYENSGKSLDHYVEWLSKLPYANRLGAHLLPHDSKVRELGSGMSRVQILRGMGLRNIKVVPRLPKDQQIEAGRLLLAKCWFDETGTADGLRALRNYTFGFDPKRKVLSQTPLHNSHSNGSDSFQYLAVGMKQAGHVPDPRGDAIFGSIMPDDDYSDRPLVSEYEMDDEI